MKNRLSIAVAVIGMLMVAPLAAQAQSKGGTTTKKKPAASSATTKKPAPSATEKEKEAAKKEASKLTATQKSKLLEILNKGDKEALIALPSIGETRAENVMKARPFKAVEDLIDVTGIGEKALAEIVKHGKTLTARSSSSTTKKKPAKTTRKPATTTTKKKS